MSDKPTGPYPPMANLHEIIDNLCAGITDEMVEDSIIPSAGILSHGQTGTHTVVMVIHGMCCAPHSGALIASIRSMIADFVGESGIAEDHPASKDLN